MQKTTRGFGLLSMLISMLVLGGLFYMAFGRGSSVRVVAETDAVELPATPHEAQAKVVSQLCIHRCTADAQACRAMALDSAAKSHCETLKSTCGDACQTVPEN